ncbi:hypothetical protein DM01DRAFT_19996 [Hesseltinella vesiculosa]|uniref:Uncharacterized protein n=1 Tax=Hesseltinella vesiculosa TaxID=101127 RepID=A0A1X2GVS6_9FUNG|nr:hypothetical protein DM01DRAFT_19996 [Hesseltinella vesiculosa]
MSVIGGMEHSFSADGKKKSQLPFFAAVKPLLFVFCSFFLVVCLSHSCPHPLFCCLFYVLKKTVLPTFHLCPPISEIPLFFYCSLKPPIDLFLSPCSLSLLKQSTYNTYGPTTDNNINNCLQHSIYFWNNPTQPNNK